MKDADLIPRCEVQYRSIIEKVFEYVQPKVFYADLLIESIQKIEYQRFSSGQTVEKPFSHHALLQLRLSTEKQKHIGIQLGLSQKDSRHELSGHIKMAIDSALLMLQSDNFQSGGNLEPIPDTGRNRYGIPSDNFFERFYQCGGFEKTLSEIERISLEQKLPDRFSFLHDIWAYTQVEEKIIADSLGIYKTQVLPSSFIQITAKCHHHDTNAITQYRTRIGEICSVQDFFSNDLSLLDHHAKRIARGYQRAFQLQTAKTLSNEDLKKIDHFVLSPSAMVFVHEAEGHNFEADIIKEGASGLFHSNGTPIDPCIASDGVDLYDGFPRDKNGNFMRQCGFGTHFIDDEGIEVKPVQLVKNGKIVAKLHNRSTASHFQEPLNGRGFSELGDERIVRMTNTYLFPSERSTWHDTLDTLITDIDFGVYLEGSYGGAVSRKGMSTTIQFAQVIENGKFTDRILLPCNLTVETLGALKNVVAFAGPVEMDDPGFCGKGQTKTVTDGGPFTKIRVSNAITLGF